MSSTYRVTLYGRRISPHYSNLKGMWRGEADSIGDAIDKAYAETPKNQRGTWVSVRKEATDE